MVSATTRAARSLPDSAVNALHSGSNMLTGTDTVLVLGTDQRPKGTHEAGANTSDRGSRSDTIMLWRVGGGVSRRLSIPRDTVAHIPGFGSSKINAAYAYGGPALAIRTIEQFTGVQINHLIVINLANFPKFIDAIGGIDVTTGRICSNDQRRGQERRLLAVPAARHAHLTGIQALTLARTRENACNAASNDLTRAGYQQKILNGIKSKLLSPASSSICRGPPGTPRRPCGPTWAGSACSACLPPRRWAARRRLTSSARTTCRWQIRSQRAARRRSAAPSAT